MTEKNASGSSDDPPRQLQEALDNILRSIHNAVIEAQVLTETQHMRQLHHYLDEDHTPKTVPVKVPVLRPEPDADPWRELELPILAIAPPTSIKMQEVAVDLKLKLQGFDGKKHGKDDNSGPVQAAFTGGDPQTDASVATVRMVFAGTEPPEAMYKLAELFNKKIG